jgi:hypothetical protein
MSVFLASILASLVSLSVSVATGNTGTGTGTGGGTATPTTSQSLPVCIVGAGPAGLSAANRLEAKGYKTVTFEKEAKVGGKCLSYYEKYDTFKLNLHELPPLGRRRLLIKQTLFTVAYSIR